MSDAFGYVAPSVDAEANEVPPPPYSPAYDLATARAEAIEWRTAAEQRAETIRQLREQLDAQTSRLTTVYREREAFNARVVAVAEQVARDNGWCRQGLTAALAELDLEPNPLTYSGTIIVHLQVSGIEADSPGEAAEWVLDNLDLSTADDYELYDYHLEGDD